MTLDVIDESSALEAGHDLAVVPGDEGAGFHVEQEVEQPSKKRKAWSFPDSEEKRPERAPLTEEEWQRVLRRLLARGKTVVFLVTREQREWAGNQAKSCGACSNVKLHGDPRRGWCPAQRFMTGITFPVLCMEYQA